MSSYSQLQYSQLFNVIPVPMFVVDQDVRIIDSNAAAQKHFGLSQRMISLRRGGEVLHCLNPHKYSAGCGETPECGKCIIRNSVSSCLKAVAVTQRPMKFTAVGGDKQTELELLITASPFPDAGNNAVLLIIEDITEFSKLKAIIPICAHCKRVRNEAEYWQQVERYFYEHIGLDFSHGICPECTQKYFGEYLRPSDTSAGS